VYYCAYSDVQSIGGVVQDRLPILLRHRSSVMYDLQHPRIVIECGHKVAIVVVLHHGELVLSLLIWSDAHFYLGCIHGGVQTDSEEDTREA